VRFRAISYARAMASAAAGPWLPFEELVDAHWRWRRDPSSEPEYREKLARFEGECGEIVDSYWCESVPSAVALTVRPRRFREPWLEFHRVSDWVTKDEPKIAELLHTCDQLTIKIASIIRGPTRLIGMRLVVASATHLISLVDEPAEHRRGADKQAALRYEEEELTRARLYYEEVGLRQAQLMYLGGMLVGGALIAALAFGVWLITGRDFSNRIVLAIVFGAAGALLSVMDRMTSRKEGFELDYELGRAPLVVFGSFRPLIGAAFGLVLYGALASSLLNIELTSGAKATTALYGLLSFAAGWSERLAKDVLDAAEHTVGASVKARREAAEEPPGKPALGAGGGS
jgi:hypothetical protein